VSSDLSGTSGVAERYAAALFELSVDNGELDQVAAELGQIQSMIDESDDLRRLIRSPVFSREDQSRAIGAIAEKSGLSKTVSNFLCVVTANNRLFALEGMIKAWRAMLSAHRGEVTAEVASATALSDSQRSALESALREAVGSKVTIEETVDPNLIGGLVVRVGSRMVDSSLRTKLQRLQLVMKGAA